MTAVRLQPVRVRLACLGLGLLALAAGCDKNTAAPPAPQASQDNVPTVTTVRPERKPLRRVIEQPAFVEAFEETPLVARISGYVQKIHVDIGDRVQGPRSDDKGKQTEPGQVLAELWVPEMEQELRQKKALVAQAEAEVEQATAALEAAEANIATALAMVQEAEAGRERAEANYERWESENQRVEGLVKQKVIDAQIRDETRNQFKAASAARKEVEAKVHSAQATAKESAAKRNKARADLTAAKARVEVAGAEEGRLRALVGYGKIRAPYDGVVTRRHVNTGDFFQPGASGVAQPLFVVARIGTVRVFADVPEADALLIRDGVPARVRVQSVKDREFEGKVTRSAWSLDAKTRTLRTEIDLPNDQGVLRPGMYAYVSFTAEAPGGFTLPAAALVTQGDQAFCVRVEGGRALRTPVKFGARYGQFVQVLKKQTKPPAKAGESGVWEDFTGEEQFVVNNPASLTDGQDVTVAVKP